jgi:hypothetical protein
MLAALGAAVLGAAPHVQHHAGPLAGAALMAAVFTFSSFVIGPAVTDSGAASTTPNTNRVPSAPPGVSPAEHEAHHR